MLLRDQRQLCGHPLTYATARVLLAGDVEVRKEYIANGPCEASSDHQRSETTHTVSQGFASC